MRARCGMRGERLPSKRRNPVRGAADVAPHRCERRPHFVQRVTISLSSK
jgi:hypothetical protein